MIKLGSLVKSSNNSLGIGKVIDNSHSEILVEYFCSPGQRLQKALPLNSLSYAKLQQQTRCYIKLKNQEKWIIGRIFAWDEDSEKYQIDLPDKKTVIINEQDIYVRCNLAVKDSIETLAIKGQETPYLYDRRFALLKSLVQQRAVSRGMTGLISANINLYPHQVEVVRRVLEDANQRYLLADEGGLGKTIEAGIILRQYLLDEPKKGAVVVVPPHLLPQWRQELEQKFYISHFPKRVAVLSFDDVHKINPKASVGLLIIDEAQQVAAMATSLETAVRQRFEAYKNLAHRSERLILLSTNPDISNEKELPILLYLLEPETYKLNDLAGFREKIKKHQILGKIIFSLKKEADALNVKTNLEQLQNLLPEDKYLLSLIKDWQKSQQETIIQTICQHVSDTYSLSRQILCNRRANVPDAIFNRQITPKEEYDLDERSYDIHEIIEKWRTAAPHQPEYQRIFLLLFLAAGTWLGILEQVIAARLSGIRNPELIKEFGNDDGNILTQTAKFPGENELLMSLRQIISQPSEDGDRIELLKIIILYRLSEILGLQSYRSNIKQLGERVKQRIQRPIPGDYLPKIVIFTGFKQSCTEIVRTLSQIFGTASVTSQQSEQNPAQAEKNLAQFQTNSSCFILVCDSTAEIGHNFQFIDWMINFDLPWLPKQLEQRISRIDRIGRSSEINFTVLVGVDLEESLHSAWYNLLKNGLAIFNQSITSFQPYITQKLPELETTLFHGGASGLLQTTESIQQEISQVEINISAENALAEINLSESENSYFAALDDYDSQHLEIKRALEGWIDQALHFKSIYSPELPDVKSYQPIKQTLVSADEFQNYFANSNIDKLGTYNRRVANQNSQLKLFRVGEGLVDAICNYLKWDDRGHAFAIWRQDTSWNASQQKEWFGFRCNYLVEANLKAVKQILAEHQQDNSQFNSWKRWIEGFFPPIIESIFIDAGSELLSTVTDESLLTILQRPYSKDKTNKLGQDYNLAKERIEVLDNFIPADNWQNICYQVRDTARQLLSERPDFQELCTTAATIAEEKLAQRVEQLRLQLNQQPGNSTLTDELKIVTAISTAIIDGIRQPEMQLDSAGFIVVSGQAFSG
ncbi:MULTISPECIES: protein DpdE [Calothrix]|uniref:DEAD/DEAH box helicase family protein n=2 Tax=Calothrix TaxID=1186 RepID=A0ABR8A2W1_9CYAN|nr:MULTISPECIES: protein DpdE [Calothrix]MBD2194286.1 DEAD/DEAH box helicase family protein [Calothrix parietina FACHB-288]MBD2229593.1 DEAD/DEAH box helicase family protein [Calothrix anomala FACHB-343]